MVNVDVSKTGRGPGGVAPGRLEREECRDDGAASMWWLMGIGGWVALVALTLVVLTAAKRADEQLARDARLDDEELEQLALAALAGSLRRPVTGMVWAVREI